MINVMRFVEGEVSLGSARKPWRLPLRKPPDEVGLEGGGGTPSGRFVPALSST